MDTHRYGATMSLDMSERFGMEVGVQRYYDAYRGRWETVPVVIPYYNFDKFKLSLDVGGILYEILRNTVFDWKNISVSSGDKRKQYLLNSRRAPDGAATRFSCSTHGSVVGANQYKRSCHSQQPRGCLRSFQSWSPPLLEAKPANSYP